MAGSGPSRGSSQGSLKRQAYTQEGRLKPAPQGLLHVGALLRDALHLTQLGEVAQRRPTRRQIADLAAAQAQFQADSDGAGEIAINLVGDDAELYNSTDRPVRADWYTAATTRMSRTPDSIDTGAGWPSLAASRNSRC
jgi:hypothetical protein